MKRIKARMNCSIELLGTSLKLREGQIVHLVAANNLPKADGIKWYARDPKWNHEGSILVSPPEVTLRK